MTVPDGYVTTRQQGPDFEVHHIHKIASFPSRASIGVYLGDHPSSDNDDMKSKGITILFGTIAHWYEKSTNEGGQTAVYDRALVRLKILPFGGGPTYADVFLVGKDTAEMDELKKVAATLRLVDVSK